MDTLENYRAEILKKNKRYLEEDDPISRLEGQCARLEQAEKKRLERALSFVKSSAEAQLNGLPQRLSDAINTESLKKTLASYAIENMREHMTISLPQPVWICGGILAALNLLALAAILFS